MTCGLLLRDPQLIENVGRLFQRLGTDRTLQADFIKSPASVIAGRYPRNDDENRSDVNEFIYFVFSNPRLKRWLARYRKNPRSRAFSEKQRADDLKGALIKYGQPQLRNRLGKLDTRNSFPVAIYKSTTYIKTLNNHTYLFIRISDPPKQFEISPMEIVSMVEQIYDSSKRRDS